MNATLDDKGIVEKTASHFGVQPSKILISEVKSEMLSTSYKTNYSGKLYNCSIYYGAVKCEYVRDADEVATPAKAAAPQTAAATTPQANGEAKEMTVAQAQARLNKLGYSVGKADGIMGNRTIEKLKLFQKSRGLPVTGFLDAPTIDALM